MTIIATAFLTIPFFVSQSVDLNLYAGQPSSSGGFGLEVWGGGAIEETAENAIAGPNALKIRTATFFQGGILRFEKPVALGSYANDPENLLAVAVYVMESRTASSGGESGGGGLTGGGGGLTGGGGSSMGGGRSAGGGLTGGGGGDAGTRRGKQMDNLRMILRTTDGKLSEAYVPLGSGGSAVGKWRRVGVPLKSIAGFSKSNKEVEAIAFAGDSPTSFYLGELRVVRDQTPIQGFISVTEYNIGINTELTFSASAEAGLSVVEYVWDFDASDGLQVEAIGQSVVHRFRKPSKPDQPFVVTLTIRDVFGLKQSWKGTVAVTVNP
jgi:hypothetical protein